MKIFERHTKSWGKFIIIRLWFVYIYWSQTDKSGWLKLFGKHGGLHWEHKTTNLIFS